MTAKPVVPRELANQDIDDAIAYYLSEGVEQAAFGFIDALEQAYVHIGRRPATGSPRYAHELNLPGLRFWPLAHYPRLVFNTFAEAAGNRVVDVPVGKRTRNNWLGLHPLAPSLAALRTRSRSPSK